MTTAATTGKFAEFNECYYCKKPLVRFFRIIVFCNDKCLRNYIDERENNDSRIQTE